MCLSLMRMGEIAFHLPPDQHNQSFRRARRGASLDEAPGVKPDRSERHFQAPSRRGGAGLAILARNGPLRHLRRYAGINLDDHVCAPAGC